MVNEPSSEEEQISGARQGARQVDRLKETTFEQVLARELAGLELSRTDLALLAFTNDPLDSPLDGCPSY
jgi:hypothetical protein